MEGFPGGENIPSCGESVQHLCRGGEGLDTRPLGAFQFVGFGDAERGQDRDVQHERRKERPGRIGLLILAGEEDGPRPQNAGGTDPIAQREVYIVQIVLRIRKAKITGGKVEGRGR